MAVPIKVHGMDSWIHLSRAKCVKEESASSQAQPEAYSCEQMEDLKFFWRYQKASI
jgi:hypothetical protein